MRNASHSALVLTWIASIAAAQGDVARSGFDESWALVEREFVARSEACGAVGAALAFVDGGAVRRFVGHGFADRDGKRPVDADTIFHWASCTKTLTGIAAMQLRERGLLSLDDLLVASSPELRAAHDPEGWLASATLRHAMSHSAGFRAATFPWGGEDWHPHEPKDWSQLVAMMPYTKVEFAPGSKFSYSNFGIVLVGRAIERASGDDYEAYMEKNVLRPLGMRSSYFDATPWHLRKHRSHGYARAADGTVRDLGTEFDTGITVSNGGLNAPVVDMARYVSFLLGARERGGDADSVLSRASLAEMWEPSLPTGGPADERIGLCFFVQQHGGQRIATHTGGQQGYVSFFYAHPASRTGAVGVWNTSSAGPAMQAIRAMCVEKLSMPLTPKLEPKGVAVSLAWKQFNLRMTRDATSLVLESPTGGHKVECAKAAQAGEVLEIDLRVETPGKDQIVTQAMVEHAIELPQAQIARAKIRISLRERGAHYLVEPAFEEVGELRLR
jgi:CubicO group peptidase (beta-lactamase class C family)